MRSLYCLLSACVARADECYAGSPCTQGDPENITNATGACSISPIIHGECEVCSGCHKQYPSCPCCTSVYDNAGPCANCFAANAVNCGNPIHSFECTRNIGAFDPCNVVSGKSGPFPTMAACHANCSFQFDCQNQKCIKAKDGKYANESACETACGKTPHSACGTLKPEQCKVWQEDIYDAMGGKNWAICSDKRNDPCACNTPFIQRGVKCDNGDLTTM
jgi:hypothetical protein